MATHIWPLLLLGAFAPHRRDIQITGNDLPCNPDAPFGLSIRLDQPDGLYNDGDNLTAYVLSERNAYLTLFDLGTSGKTTVIYPNEWQPEPRLAAGSELVVPGPADQFQYRVTLPNGVNRIVAVATTAPLDLDPLDLGQYWPAGRGMAQIPAARARGFARGVRDILAVARPDSWAVATVSFQIGPVPGIPPPPPPAPASAWALVAGVAAYPPGGPSPLTYTVADAEAFAQSAMQTMGVPQDHLRLLCDAQASPSAIEAGLQWLGRNAGAEDTVYFYFSGHGGSVADEDGDEADGRDELTCFYGGNVLDDEFARWTEAVRASRFVIFLDTCHSGGATRGMKSMMEQPLPGGRRLTDTFADREIGVAWRDLDRVGTCTFAACKPDQMSAENGRLRHGVFTYYLLQGIQGSADANGDSKITVRECFDYTRREVVRDTGGAQEPYLLYHLSSECYLRR